MKILYIDCFYGFSAHMLLGALADMCEVPSCDEYTVLKEELKRNSIECIGAKALDAEQNDITPSAISQVINSLSIDYVMCSPVPLDDSADGDVIGALQDGGVEMYPSERGAYITSEGAKLLSEIAVDCGSKPPMEILAVGYGADECDKDAFLCVTVGEYGFEASLENYYEYGEYV